ncbi:CBO0543 family protein [Pelotomaculum propionicicum]|uniref:CBO0543 family protein n=1 Tax=Pelotomaculum propionicicum TaxID=258475 RepID=UPI003B80F4D5
MFNSVINHPLWGKQIELRAALRDVNMDHYLQNNVFTFSWWLSLIFVILVWCIWWKRVDKYRLLEIVCYGLLVSVVVIIIDILGVELVLWGYPNMLIPLMPPLFSADIALLPVTYMLIYQYYAEWKEFFIAILITSFVLAFIGEPIAIWLELYEMNNWKHLYSFPIYIIIGLSLKWVVIKINLKQVSYK